MFSFNVSSWRGKYCFTNNNQPLTRNESLWHVRRHMSHNVQQVNNKKKPTPLGNTHVIISDVAHVHCQLFPLIIHSLYPFIELSDKAANGLFIHSLICSLGGYKTVNSKNTSPTRQWGEPGALFWAGCQPMPDPATPNSIWPLSPASPLSPITLFQAFRSQQRDSILFPLTLPTFQMCPDWAARPVLLITWFSVNECFWNTSPLACDIWLASL